MPHQLIASPYPEGHLVVRPGYDGAVRIGAARYAELRDAPPDATLPSWLAEAARAGWGIDLAGRPAAGTVLVRPETAYGYARASISTAAARQALIAHEKAGTATRVKGSRPGIADTWTPAAPEAPAGEAPPADTPGAGTPGESSPPRSRLTAPPRASRRKRATVIPQP